MNGIPGNKKSDNTNKQLLTTKEAEDLSDLFKIFSNSTRLRLLQKLILDSETTVTELANALSMNPQAISNQLQRLSDKAIVKNRRNGNNIYYRVIDPCVEILIERGICLQTDSEKQRLGD